MRCHVYHAHLDLPESFFLSLSFADDLFLLLPPRSESEDDDDEEDEDDEEEERDRRRDEPGGGILPFLVSWSQLATDGHTWSHPGSVSLF